ncbi:helix-turn-helix domain-containing protein [Nocardia sp. NPDC050712]|uniref:PucR family transcriptional regulator n=1 Tax=Nocardia sp. NPDC050712 TaxID=3155518 RepID=UPI0033E2CBB3
MSSPVRSRAARSSRGAFGSEDTVTSCDPGDLAVDAMRAGSELALLGHRGADVSDRMAALERCARQWAKLGLGLDRLQQLVHQGYRSGSDRAYLREALTEADAGVMRRHLDILESLHVRLTRAYTRQLPAPTNSHHAATRNLAVALLRGELAGPLARHCGIAISARYHLVAVGFTRPRTRDTATPTLAVRIDAALTERCGTRALSIIGEDGGTLLIPHDLVEDAELGALVSELAPSMIAVAVVAEPADLPAAGKQAHELLDTAMSLRITPGMYRISDLGLYFQLTRPGPARDVLRALLEPLDDHPELLQTLSVHLATDFNRQRTAGQLHVHPNTLDYRLKRIHLITGCDPTTAAGLWRLRSAMVVRSYTEQYRSSDAVTG